MLVDEGDGVDSISAKRHAMLALEVSGEGAAHKEFAAVEAPWPDDDYEASQRESLQAPLGLALPTADSA